jgi:hypothetical protein
VAKDAGKLAQAVTAAATTVDFGKTMTPGEWVVFQGLDYNGVAALEWMLVGTLASGTIYNVTRNVDGSGANHWAENSPFAVVGVSGDARIELVAGATATIRLITQGATWDAYTVQAEMSTTQGAITAGAGVVTLDEDGLSVDGGTTSIYDKNKIKLTFSEANLVEFYIQVISGEVQNYITQLANADHDSKTYMRIYAPSMYDAEFNLETYVDDVLQTYFRLLAASIEINKPLHGASDIVEITGLTTYPRMNFKSGDDSIGYVIDVDGGGGSAKECYIGEDADSGILHIRTAAGLQLNTGGPANEIAIDDTLAADSDIILPTQSAVKGYVDAATGDATISLKVISDGDTLVTGDGQLLWTVPAVLDGWELVPPGAGIFTPSSSGLPTVQIHNLTTGHDMLSTLITIDENEYNSYDAEDQPVVDDDYKTVSAGDRLRFDVDVAGTGTKGLEVQPRFKRAA